MKKNQPMSQAGHGIEGDPDLQALFSSSREIERQILGSILLDNKVYFSISDRVSIEDMTLDSHRRIFAAMSGLLNQGQSADLVTLSDALAKRKELESVGGVTYLSTLTELHIFTAKSLKNWADAVSELSRRRRLYQTLNATVHQTLDRTMTLEEIVGGIESNIMRVMADDARNGAKLVKEYTSEVFSQLMLLRSRKTDVVGLTSGLAVLDDSTTGLRDGEIVVVAGRPGHGKSSLAEQCAVKNCERGVPVGFFSLEMRRDELMLRAVSSGIRVDHLLLRAPNALDDVEMDRIAMYMKGMNEWPLWIDDTGGLHINQLLARARMLVAKGAKLIIIDYIQKVRHSEKDPRIGMNVVSEALREFAKNTRVPVVILSQLKRPEGNPNARPTMYDLKESGNLEQDAHVIFLLYRPVDKFGEFTGEDEVIIGKQRNGPTGIVPTYYYGKYLTFTEREIVTHKPDMPKAAATVERQRSFTETEHEGS